MQTKEIIPKNHSDIIKGVYSKLDSGYNKLKQSYIRTYCGVDFTIFSPQPEMILIEDIAHSLSRLCRYGGHCNQFYSVARHSIITSYLVQPKFALEALMHDATEGYIGDCVTPLKKYMPQFNEIENSLYKVIAQKYGLSYPMSEETKNADAAMIGYEWDFFMEKESNSELHDFYNKYFKSVDIEQTEEDFLTRFKELFENK